MAMKKISILLLCVLLAGCLAEDRDNCPSGLRFEYSFADGGVDGIVGDMRLWVFDSDGKCMGMLRNVSGAELPDGVYTFVAWGSSCDNLENCYSAECSELSDFRVKVKDPAQFSDLYYAIAEDVRIKSGTVVAMKFTRHTSTVRVKVVEAGTRVDSPLDIYIKGRKGMYGHDGRVHGEAPEHRYYGVDGDIRIQRLDVDFHVENPVTLHIESGGEALIKPFDVVQTLLKSPLYFTQEDLDDEDIFEIEVRLGVDLVITILVDGYVIEIIEPIIQIDN